MKVYDVSEFKKIDNMPVVLRDLSVFPTPYSLEVACGSDYREPVNGWIHSDCSTHISNVNSNHLEIGCYSWNIPLPDGSCKEIFSKGFFEHLTYADAERTLIEWKRVLISGGLVKFNFPPIDHAIHLYNTKQVDLTFLIHVLYGWQMQESDLHRSGWTKEYMEEFLKENVTGFTIEEMYWGDSRIDANGEVIRYEGDPYTYAGGHIWVTLRKE